MKKIYQTEISSASTGANSPGAGGEFFAQTFLLYRVLSLLESFRVAKKTQKKKHLKQALADRAELQKLVSGVGAGQGMMYLADAAIAQMKGDFNDAVRNYDRSIAAFREGGHHREAAIACELAGRMCIEEGNDDVATIYLGEAVGEFRQSDPAHDIAALQTKYPQHVRNSRKNHSTGHTPEGQSHASVETPVDSIDLAAVIKASHMISVEIILEKLLRQLMIILIENAGAETLHLLLEKEGRLMIESSGRAGNWDIAVNRSLPADESDLLPLSLVNYVKRTLDPVVLSNAAKEGMFARDRYIEANAVRSIACIPLVSQGVFRGMVYLENRLTAGAFTRERIETVKLISTQAAISLENALLFEKKKAAEMELQQQYEEIESQYQEMEAMNEKLARASDDLIHANEALAIFKKFAEASRQGMGMTDLDGTITYINPALCSILEEESPESAIGKRWASYNRDDINELMRTTILPSVLSGKDWVGEIVLNSVRGKATPTIQGFFAIRDNTGSAMYLAAIITDITERKRLEEQLMQAQKMEAVGRLAGGIAHDFNNLLTAIMGYSELLLRQMDPDDENIGCIREILKAADRSASLTRQLLAFSRKQMLKPVDLDLNGVILDMEKMLNRLLGEDIRLFTRLSSGPAHVNADRGQLEQVIMNLIINARDAMENGGAITISTSFSTIDHLNTPAVQNPLHGDYVCLSIADTGKGINPDDMNKIFEPFFSTKGPDKGTGLGLSVVYGIIAQHNGWIDVSSSVGRGSAFHIYLPAINPPPEEAGKADSGPKASRGRGERILLVEDQHEVLNFITSALGGFGYTVMAATSAHDAMDIFEREKGEFDLVFSDVVLPDMNGVQFIEYIKNRKPGMPVILSSGYTDQKSQWDLIRDKGYFFLEKPYSLDTLLKTVYDMIRGIRE